MDCREEQIISHSDCKLLSSNLNVALDYSQVVNYSTWRMLTQHIRSSYINTLDTNPPKGGIVFLYDLGLDEAQ